VWPKSGQGGPIARLRWEANDSQAPIDTRCSISARLLCQSGPYAIRVRRIGGTHRAMRTACRMRSVTVGCHTVNKLILAAPAALALAACGTTAATPPARTVALTASAQALTCRAYMSNSRPADNTKTVVHVSTQASVKVFTVAFYKTINRAYFVRASSSGRAQVAYFISGATPGRRVEVVVTVVRGHRANTCYASFTPRRAGSSSPSPSPTSPAPSPSSSAACHPLSSAGNCYKAGEYCPKADHGMDGVAQDGEAIVCEDNNGWRWEPA
jgi:hypothetical protein